MSAPGQHGVPARIHVGQVEHRQGQEQLQALPPVGDHAHIYQRFARVTQTTVRIREPLQVTVVLVNRDIVELVAKLVS